MRGNTFGPMLMLVAALMFPVTTLAQQPSPPPTVWPDPPRVQQPAPAPQPGTAARPPAPVKKKPAPKPRAEKPSGSAQAIACDGPFAKDSSDTRVAEAFGRENVVYTVVDGPEGTKLNATVVFPKDPKRRLEVLWHDPAARVRPLSIVLAAGSSWTGPKGVRVGASLGEVEKLNGKPFKLSGFGGDYGGSVVDWQSGALDTLAGGCRLGVRFDVDANAPGPARSKVSGDSEFLSTNADMRAVKPKVSEMFFNYPE